jgi:predicted transposase YbfD/YdcC
VTRFLDDAQASGFAGINHAYSATGDGEHGRVETRRSWITFQIDWLGAQGSWTTLTRMGLVESQRDLGDPVPIDRRSVLTALPAHAQRLAPAVRQHWGSEHALHGVLEVSCEEDACRMRKDQGAQTFAGLRHIALHLLRREPHHKRGIKARRKRAAWDRDYLVRVLMG